MKEKVWNYLLGLMLIGFGISFMLSAEKTFGTIVLVAGITIIVFNITKLIIYLKKSEVISNLPIITSILGVLLGIVLVGNTEKSVETVTFILGVWLLIGGISSLMVLINKDVDRKELYKPIFKIIVGTIAFIAPVIITKAAGYVVGIILILSGISVFINKEENEVVYKVKVKK